MVSCNHTIQCIQYPHTIPAWYGCLQTQEMVHIVSPHHTNLLWFPATRGDCTYSIRTPYQLSMVSHNHITQCIWYPHTITAQYAFSHPQEIIHIVSPHHTNILWLPATISYTAYSIPTPYHLSTVSCNHTIQAYSIPQPYHMVHIVSPHHTSFIWFPATISYGHILFHNHIIQYIQYSYTIPAQYGFSQTYHIVHMVSPHIPAYYAFSQPQEIVHIVSPHHTNLLWLPATIYQHSMVSHNHIKQCIWNPHTIPTQYGLLELQEMVHIVSPHHTNLLWYPHTIPAQYAFSQPQEILHIVSPHHTNLLWLPATISYTAYSIPTPYHLSMVSSNHTIQAYSIPQPYHMVHIVSPHHTSIVWFLTTISNGAYGIHTPY